MPRSPEGFLSTVWSSLRRGASSGVFAGVTGVVTLVRSLRSFRRGETGRGLARLLVGGALLAIAAGQRRSREPGAAGGHGVARRAAVDTSSDVEAAADAGTGEPHETGPEQSAGPGAEPESVDPETATGVDEPDTSPGSDIQSDVDRQSGDEGEGPSDTAAGAAEERANDRDEEDEST